MQEVAKQHGVVLIVPMYEEEQPGVYYNTAAVIDADGKYLGKHRKNHIPQVKGFWEKFYFRPGNLGYPVFDTAVGRIGVYICYERHFPEGWRALGLAGAKIVFNPSATSRGLSQYLWRLEQPAAAVANEYFVGAINRVGVEPLGDNDFYGQTYFADPRGQLIGDAASDTEDEVVVRDLDMGTARRGPRPVGVLPRPPPGHLRPAHGGLMTTLDQGWHTSFQPSARAPVADVRRGRRDRRRAVGAPGTLDRHADTDDRRHRQVRAARRHRRAHAHGDAVRRHASRPTPSRPAPPRRRGAARPRSSTSPCRPRAPHCCPLLDKWHEKADGNCAIDYGFHMIVSDVNDGTLKEMDACVDAGVNRFKMFMAYPGVFYSTDGEILLAMQRARANGGTIMMHAENGIAIDQLVAQAIAAGRPIPCSTA